MQQSAGLAEFDGDTDTVTALVAAAQESEGSFAHVIARAREERALAEQVAARKGELSEAGVRVIEVPAYNDATVKPLRELAAGPEGGELDTEAHAECPGHVAWVGSN